MTDCNSIESVDSCPSDSEIDDSFCAYDGFDFDFKARLQRGQNKMRKGSTWDVDRNRMKLLKTVTSLPIPHRSIEILSKLCANHQLKEIVSVLDVGNRSVSVHARMNIKHELYRDLESSNVFIKIFTHKNRKKPDIEAAKKYNLRVHSKNRNSGKFPHKGYFYQYYNEFEYTESLTILRIDNIVIMKMVGCGKPATNLVEMMRKKNSDLKGTFYEILQLIKLFREKSYTFWNGPSSAKHVLWHNGEWVIITKNRTDSSTVHWKQKQFYGRNLMSLVRMFYHFGIRRKAIKASLHNVFNSNQPTYHHREMLAYAHEKIENFR